MSVLEQLNSGTMYLTCGTIVAFVAIISAVFMVRAWRAGKALGMDTARMKRAMTASATFSVLPSVGILLGVIALSGSLGITWPWLRLSVIGALHYETQVAQAAAEQLGLQLSGETMTAGAFSTIALLMSVCIMWGMILMTVFGKHYLKKLSGDRKPKTEHFANKYGALTCAYYFWKNLKDTGWEISGGYADIDRGGYVRGADFVPQEPAGNPQRIGSSRSPALSRIVRDANVRSDNFYAEAIFRQMGEKATGIAVYDSCRVAVSEVLSNLLPEGELEGLRQEDGSGLSRLNTLSPAFMAAFLRSMSRSGSFDAFLSSLPRPGEGTVTTLLPRLSESQKARIRLKSGSMDGVLCYSGYILYSDGSPKLVFSLMVNGATVPTSQLRLALGEIIAAML